MTDQKTPQDAIDDALQPFLESGLFRDLNNPKVNKVYRDMVAELTKLMQFERASGVYLAAKELVDLDKMPFTLRPGETSTSNPRIRSVDDVRSYLLDLGNSLLPAAIQGENQ